MEMQNTESMVAELPGRPAAIQCGPLPKFDRTDVASMRRAFQNAVSLSFQQSWLPAAEAHFSPGTVRLGWHANVLMVFAELTDRDASNRATELNQPLWELGDVFEMFFKSAEMEGYVELQVSPQNQRLQLSHPHDRAAEWICPDEEFAKCLLWDELFYSRTWPEPEANQWLVYAEIPARTVCGSDRLIERAQWRFSFGRYDYTRGVAEPVISSTSRHAKPNFHRQQEWGVMTFNRPSEILNK